ncbi:hypothetical protein [Aureimonas sp. ME7]|uniref:hypothetical protein n=1 Tax=Aureimonas sp. ME7 TaxID=2744252 RepID=UPI001FCE4F8B|nr:hypothetical protein [Aureimonas sp. ME7]
MGGLRDLARKHTGRRGAWREADEAEAPAPEPSECWLCRRPLGTRVEWHHPLPKSRGGRETVPVHPICHRAIHASFTNTDLERHAEAGLSLASHPDLGPFLRWIAGKPPDFHAPTRRAR